MVEPFSQICGAVVIVDMEGNKLMSWAHNSRLTDHVNGLWSRLKLPVLCFIILIDINYTCTFCCCCCRFATQSHYTVHTVICRHAAGLCAGLHLYAPEGGAHCEQLVYLQHAVRHLQALHQGEAAQASKWRHPLEIFMQANLWLPLLRSSSTARTGSLWRRTSMPAHCRPNMVALRPMNCPPANCLESSLSAIPRTTNVSDAERNPQYNISNSNLISFAHRGRQLWLHWGLQDEEEVVGLATRSRDSISFSIYI